MDSYKEYASKDFLEDQIDEKTNKYLPLEGGTLKSGGYIRLGQNNKLIFSTVTSQPMFVPGSNETVYLDSYVDHFAIEIEKQSATDSGVNSNLNDAKSLKIFSLKENDKVELNTPLVMNHKQIHAVGDPIYDYDAATKAYVNNQIESFFSFGTQELEVGQEAPENITGRVYICYEE